MRKNCALGLGDRNASELHAITLDNVSEFLNDDDNIVGSRPHAITTMPSRLTDKIGVFGAFAYSGAEDKALAP